MKKLILITITSAILLLFGGKFEGCTAGILANLVVFVTVAGVVRCGFHQHRENRFYYRMEVIQ